MNILIINAGSSSLKYQLMDPETGVVSAKGLCERIGIDGRLNHNAHGNKVVKDIPMPTHSEAIAATQAAIWQAAHGPSLSFPKFCRYVFNPTYTKYGSLCSYNELQNKDNTAINATIETVYNYLLSLPPVAATSKVVSSSSFLKMENLLCKDNGDGTCTVSVDVTVDVDMEPGDNLDLYITLAEKSSEKIPLSDGEQTKTLTIKDMPAADVSGDIKLFISGTQTVSGFFYFDAEGGREASQAMVAYDSSQQPVEEV